MRFRKEQNDCLRRGAAGQVIEFRQAESGRSTLPEIECRRALITDRSGRMFGLSR